LTEETPPPQETPTKVVHRRIIRRPSTAPGWFMAAMVALVVLVGVSLSVVRYGVLTPQGRMVLEARTDGLKLGRIGRLKVEGLSGDIWRDFGIQRLTISDENGVWLEAKGVGVVWHYGALFRRRFEAEAIHIEQVTVIRRPTLAPKGKDRQLPLSFDVDTLKARVETLPAFSRTRGLYDVQAGFDIERVGGGQGTVAIASLLHVGDGLKSRFRYGRDKALDISVDAVEAQGGALAGAIGLAPDRPFALTVKAVGKTDAGTIRAIARSGEVTPVDVNGSWSKGVGRGTAKVLLTESTLTATQVRRFGPEATIDVTSRLSGNKDLNNIILTARSENLTLLAAGPVDFATRTAPSGLAVEAQIADLSRLARYPDMGAGRVKARLTGTPADFRLAGDVVVQDLSLAGYRLAAASGPAEVSRNKGGWTIKADASGRGGSGAGVFAALMGAAPKVSATLSIIPERGLVIREAKARGAGLILDASGNRTLAGGFDFKGNATVSNLAAARRGASGVVSAKWSAAYARAGSPWVFRADAKGEKFATGIEQIDRLIGGEPHLVAAAQFAGGAWTITRADLEGTAGNVGAAGLYGPNGALKLAVDWNAKGPFRAGPVEIAGAMRGKGLISGTISQPHADLAADIDAIDIGKLKTGPAKALITFAQGPGGADGMITISGDSNYGPAYAATAFRFADGGVDLAGIDARAGGVVAAGALSLRDRTPSSADLTVTVGPGAFLQAGKIDAQVKVVDNPAGPQAAIAANAEGLRWAGGSLETAVLTANGPLNRIPYRINADMRLRDTPLTLAGGGIASEDGLGYAVSFEGEGRSSKTPLRTLRPLIVRFGGPELTADASLAIGAGKADIQARQADGAVQVRGELDDIELSVLSEDLAGRVDAKFSADGRGEALSGDLDAALENARSRDGPQEAGIDGTFKASLRGERLTLDLAARNETGLASTANFVLPVEASAAPFRVAINRRRSMEGRFNIDGELQPIWDLFFGGSRTLGGRLTAQGTIGGTLADPTLSGRAELAAGRFEDFATGLKLRDVAIAADLDQTAIHVNRFTSKDANDGTLQGSGLVSLVRGGQSNFVLNAQRFLLIDNDLARAIASGSVTVVRGADGKATLTGKLTVDRADIVADPPTPSGVVPMEVREINIPRARVAQMAAPARRGPAIGLDVTLTAPRAIFVRGRGLDAELSLDAKVSGDTASPQLTGVARIVRGDYDFAGKRFEFDERGVVYLASSPDRIRLDLTATREDPSLNAVVKIEGTAAKPLITLTSTPVLPNDEVLSQVLFGRSASQLTPLEAAQLAAALTSLATGGGFDIIGGLRSLAGLDRLALAGGDATGVTVSGGKYLTDNVYLELTGGGREGPSAQVEWRVRRNLSIISRLAGDGDTRLSVRWRRDRR